MSALKNRSAIIIKDPRKKHIEMENDLNKMTNAMKFVKNRMQCLELSEEIIENIAPLG